MLICIFCASFKIVSSLGLLSQPVEPLGALILDVADLDSLSNRRCRLSLNCRRRRIDADDRRTKISDDLRQMFHDRRRERAEAARMKETQGWSRTYALQNPLKVTTSVLKIEILISSYCNMPTAR